MNDNDQFKDFEKDFNQLKEDYRAKKISEGEYKARLKSLQLRDNKGRNWTIGAQSGKWYCYDGVQWVESDPPSLQDKKAICIYCGFENDLEDEVCVNCGGGVDEAPESCDQCGEILDKEASDCSKCSVPVKTMNVQSKQSKQNVKNVKTTQDEFETLVLKGPHFSIKSFVLGSLFFFMGGIGCVFGIILGAFAGTTNFFPGIESILPSFLSDLQGGLYGGIVYSLLGGILGFLALGIFGVLSGLLMNLVSTLFGGIRVKVNRLE
jgi:hypothetical protein